MGSIQFLSCAWLCLAVFTGVVLGSPVPGQYSISASWFPFASCNDQGTPSYTSCSNGRCFPVCSNEMAGVRINQTHAAIFGGYASSATPQFVNRLWIWDSSRSQYVFESINSNLSRTWPTGWVSSTDGKFTIWGGGTAGADNGFMLSAAITTSEWTWQANSAGTTLSYNSASSPGPRSHMAWWRYAGKTRIFGAFNSGPPTTGYKDLWEWSDEAQTWSFVSISIKGIDGLRNIADLQTSTSTGAFTFSDTAFPAARNEPTYATAPATSKFTGRTYIFGGNFIANTHFADFWAFDNDLLRWANYSGTARSGIAETWSPATLATFSPNNFPSGRSYGMMWIDNMGYVWMFGGYYSSPEVYLNDLWVFSPYLNQWAKVQGDTGTGSCSNPSRPTRRAKSAFWTDDKFMYLFGGFSSSCFGDTWRLNASVTLVSCPAGYEIQSGEHLCQPCIDGKFAGISTGYKCNLCSDGQESTDGISCSLCGDGTYRSGSMPACVLCNAGTISNGTHCNPCPLGAEANSGRTQCFDCTGVGYRNSTMNSCADCPINSVPNNARSSCLLCATGQYRSENMSSCEACPNGQYRSDSMSSCETCQAGRVSDGTQCVECPRGSEANVAQTQCTNCTGLGYRDSTLLFCANCPDGSIPEETRTSCSFCPSNFYRNSTMTNCSECPSNTRNNQNFTACIPCLQNQIYDSSLDQCYYCPDGFEDFGTTCISCTGNTYSNASTFGVCRLCPVTQISTGSRCVAPVTCTATQCTFNCINNNNTCIIGAEVIEVAGNQTVDVTGTVSVAGNVTVTGGSTIRISSGSTLTVAECLTVSEGSSLQVVVSSASQNGSIIASYDSRCSSVPPVSVSSTVDECQLGRASVKETQESATRARLEVVFTSLPSDSGGCNAGNIQGEGMSMTTIGIIAGSVAGGLVLIVLILVFAVKPIRRKIFPYSARRTADMKSNDEDKQNEEEMKPNAQHSQAPAEPPATVAWRPSRPSISNV